jgi:hypothetical protein
VIPDGYEGWVKMDHLVRNAPALTLQNGYRVIKVSPDGYVQTSSESLAGWAHDSFQYANGTELAETGWGEDGRVWGDIVHWEMACSEDSNGSECHTTGRATDTCYFIGTEEQFKTAGECASVKWPKLSDQDRIPLPK